MAGKNIKLTLSQGTNLLRTAHKLVFPEKVGEKTFSAGVRATLQKKFRQTFKLLKKVSPIYREENLLYFGPREQWNKKELSDKKVEQIGGLGEDFERVVYSAKNWRAETEVRLTGEARDGIYWILYLWSHPASQMCLGAGEQEIMVWPLASLLKATTPLEKATGISEKESIEIDYEDETEELPEGEETLQLTEGSDEEEEPEEKDDEEETKQEVEQEVTA